MRAALAWPVLVVALIGGGTAAAGAAATRAAVPQVRADVEPVIDSRLAAQKTKAMAALALGKRWPGLFKTPLRLKATTDPWGAMADLEAAGLGLASVARGGLPELATLLDGLSAAIGKPAAAAPAIERRRLVTPADHAGHIAAVLQLARKLRDEALAKVPADKHAFLMTWPTNMLKAFGPQLPLNRQTLPFCVNDRAFCAFVHLHVDWAKLVAAAKALLALSQPAYLAELNKALERARPIRETVPGITGELLLKKTTPHGLIVIGGRGPNTYEPAQPIAVLIDLGGSDTYKGSIAASGKDCPNCVAIDLAGDDSYDGRPLGLATGRLGVGLLVDLGGKDVYRLAQGCGGAGFGGIGILCDAAGDDTYVGSKYTQGAAIAGIGLLLDLGGNDTHTSFGSAIGFGGPVGVGAVIDVAGNDSYQCGRKYPSGYNRSDAPKAKPGDPKFQFTAMGLGMGLGRRVFPASRQAGQFALAGGVGMVLDLAGDDRTESSNFSQGCGYYFGVGLKLDLAGRDVHGAARYGHASGAHCGMGLFVDYDGEDTYASTGPTYNAGCAWDHSAFLCIDGGTRGDRYDLARTAGLGRADIGSWAVFADLGGDDRYLTGSGLGAVSRGGLAVFYDQAGADDYRGVRSAAARGLGNGKTFSGKAGEMFLDR